MPQSWPLVGRAEELEFIEQAIDRPGSVGVVVAGAPGVGKSRLLAEAISHAGERGLATASAQATHAASSIPFGAFAHLLPPDLVGAGPRNLLRVAGVALTQRAPNGSLVLGIDDAHLLDQTSAALVHHVAESGECFLVVALRSGEAVPDSITALWKDELADRLEIQPLSREEVEQLLEGVLGARVDGVTSHQLWEATKGNVLFLRELVLGGLESGILVQRSGLWVTNGPWAAIPRLMDAVEARVGEVAREERAVLEIVSLGEPIETSFLEALAEADALESVERRNLLDTGQNGRRWETRAHHPLYAETTRARTPPSRARAIERRLADLLQATGARRRGDLLRLATWRLESGGATDPQLFLAAAHRAMALFHHELAERLALAAADAGGGVLAGHVLAQAMSGQGRYEDADRLLAELEPSCKTDWERAQVASARAFNLFWHLDRRSEAERVLEVTRARLSHAKAADELTGELGSIVIFGRSVDEGLEAVNAVLERRVAGDRALLMAAMAAAFAYSFSGRTREAQETVEHWMDLARARTDEVPFAPTWLRGNHYVALAVAGHLLEATAAAEELNRESVELQADLIRGPHLHYLGWVYLVQGKVQTAVRWNKEAMGVLQEVDFLRHLSSTLADLAHCEALLGNAPVAQETLAEALGARVASFRMDEGFIGRAETWTAVARGELSRGVELALGTAERVGAMGQRFPEALSLHDAVRIGEPAPSLERLGELGRLCDGELIPSLARHAGALSAHDADGLRDVSVTFEEMGALLYAAEAAAQATRFYREAGRTGSAFASAARARALADRCEGARTPALEDIDGALPLTKREREVASLAAGGLSSREIADRLVVSVRTVDNHLHSVYSKLGVEGRDELSVILEPNIGAPVGGGDRRPPRAIE